MPAALSSSSVPYHYVSLFENFSCPSLTCQKAAMTIHLSERPSKIDGNCSTGVPLRIHSGLNRILAIINDSTTGFRYVKQRERIARYVPVAPRHDEPTVQDDESLDDGCTYFLNKFQAHFPILASRRSEPRRRASIERRWTRSHEEQQSWQRAAQAEAASVCKIRPWPRALAPARIVRWPASNGLSPPCAEIKVRWTRRSGYGESPRPAGTTDPK